MLSPNLHFATYAVAAIDALGSDARRYVANTAHATETDSEVQETASATLAAFGHALTQTQQQQKHLQQEPHHQGSSSSSSIVPLPSGPCIWDGSLPCTPSCDPLFALPQSSASCYGGGGGGGAEALFSFIGDTPPLYCPLLLGVPNDDDNSVSTMTMGAGDVADAMSESLIGIAHPHSSLPTLTLSWLPSCRYPRSSNSARCGGEEGLHRAEEREEVAAVRATSTSSFALSCYHCYTSVRPISPAFHDHDGEDYRYDEGVINAQNCDQNEGDPYAHFARALLMQSSAGAVGGDGGEGTPPLPPLLPCLIGAMDDSACQYSGDPRQMTNSLLSSGGRRCSSYDGSGSY